MMPAERGRHEGRPAASQDLHINIDVGEHGGTQRGESRIGEISY